MSWRQSLSLFIVGSMLFPCLFSAITYAALLPFLITPIMTLNIDISCTHMAWGLGDVTADINTAFADANAMARNAVNVLLTLLGSSANPYGNRNFAMSPLDRARIEELMVAFFVPPKHPGYSTVTQELGSEFWVFDSVTKLQDADCQTLYGTWALTRSTTFRPR